MDPGNFAVVPRPHVVAGRLSVADLGLTGRWLALNEAAVLDYWNALVDRVGAAAP